MTLIDGIAERIVAITYADLPTEAVHWAKAAILDTVGVTLAGAAEPLLPAFPISTPTPIASTRVAIPAISAVLAVIPCGLRSLGGGGGGGGSFEALTASMKTTASMKGRRGSPRLFPHSRQ